ncbi:uncharacterized protein LOC111273794 isoform X1 [Varroa jacobsoni]|uniref:uncharacterized protein LOC111273794 isoform X1 n=1 Tax=Varroa jacobsoni TaxID=62625 RepID=UPI000BF6400A|nr:uncharacterized protein LOC111273794 isoform X1 [Varroa jacobsoni]
MSRQEVVALKRELLAFWPNNRYGHSTTAPTNEKLKEADDELEDRISRVLAMQRQHKEQLLHEMSPLAPRRPRSAVGRLSGQGSQSMLGGQAARTAGGRQWGDKMSQSLLEENTHSDSSEKQDICTELMTSSQKTSGSVSTHRSRRDNIMTRSVPDLPPSHTGYRSAGIPTPSYGHGHHSSSHNNINNTTSNNNISHNNALNSSGSNPAMTTSQASSSRAQSNDNRSNSGSVRVSRLSSYSVPRSSCASKAAKTATVQPHRTTALYRRDKDKAEIERLKARREFLHKNATKIQAAWRGFITRKRQEKEIQQLRMRRIEEHLMHFVRRMETLENTVRRQESDLAEEKKARLTNQEMFSRMLNSMDNIERHLTAICVGDGEETLLELPGVQQVAPTVTGGKMVATKTPDQEVETTQEETIESLSTRLSRLESMIMNLSAKF